MAENKAIKTSIGGQALIEGVMMRGPKLSAMALRLPDGGIEVEQWETASNKKWYRKAPFIRGGFNMIESMVFGYKCLMKSAEKAGIEEGEPSRFEKWLSQKLGNNLTTAVSVFAVVMGIGLALLMFTVLPTFLVSLVNHALPELSRVGKSMLEGLLKIAVFIAYLSLVTRLKEIRRVFEYHGAEHKTIACYEARQELTVENVRANRRFHPRCGTSFLLIVLVISILVFSVVSWESLIYRVLLKILLLPVVVGISYEIIKFAGRHDNLLTRAISAPGLWLQNLTTYEPDDSQIEVAIASMLPVIPAGEGEDKW